MTGRSKDLCSRNHTPALFYSGHGFDWQLRPTKRALAWLHGRAVTSPHFALLIGVAGAA